MELRELSRAIDAFLSTLGDTERRVFIARYWFMTPQAEIAASFGFTRPKVASMLARTRAKLRAALEKEGYV